MRTASVHCETHGTSNRALVCRHLVDTLRDERPRGAYWSRDDDGCINAYCGGCARALAKANDAWTDEVVAGLDVRIICEGCFCRIAELNGFGELD